MKQTNIKEQVKNWERDQEKFTAALKKLGESNVSEKQLKKFQSDYEKLVERGQKLNQKLSV